MAISRFDARHIASYDDTTVLLHEPETFTVTYGLNQFASQLILAAVNRQVEQVETGVCHRQVLVRHIHRLNEELKPQHLRVHVHVDMEQVCVQCTYIPIYRSRGKLSTICTSINFVTSTAKYLTPSRITSGRRNQIMLLQLCRYLHLAHAVDGNSVTTREELCKHTATPKHLLYT